MNKPILIILAAGMGSRFGGPKQVTPIDEQGHFIIDYSLYDARRAGFERVVFVIKPEMEEDFREAIGRRVEKSMEVRYAFQRLDDLPEGFAVPPGREKPWGTAHATLSARKLVDAPFAAINADDFYGAVAFREIYRFLASDVTPSRQAMVGYHIGNTITENGEVARGVCSVDAEGNLVEIIERTHIEAREGGAAYTEDGKQWTFLPAETVVSLNMWGFARETMALMEARFADCLRENLPKNPLKYEYFLPLVVNIQLQEGSSAYSVLPTPDKWYGITYGEDLPVLRDAVEDMRRKGLYPLHLWGEGS